LLKWLNHRRPTWHDQMWNRIGPPISRVFGRATMVKVALNLDYRQEIAQWGFEILGEDGRSAVPDLVQLANSNRENRGSAIRALRSTGTDGLWQLMNIATNRSADSICRINAVIAIGCMGRIGTNATPAIPVLVGCIEDPMLNQYAADALGKLGLESAASVPAL